MVKRKSCAPWLLAALISLCAPVAGAALIDGVSVEAGHGFGIPSTNLFRVNVDRDWGLNLWEGESLVVTGFWQASVGVWRGDRTIYDVGVTPVFVLKPKSAFFGTVRPYFEAAVGAHLISEARMYKRKFSTNYQFGDHAGLGIRFGAGQQYDLSYKLQHLSNASLGHNNDGINFNILRFGYHF